MWLLSFWVFRKIQTLPIEDMEQWGSQFCIAPDSYILVLFSRVKSTSLGNARSNLDVFPEQQNKEAFPLNLVSVFPPGILKCYLLLTAAFFHWKLVWHLKERPVMGAIAFGGGWEMTDLESHLRRLPEKCLQTAFSIIHFNSTNAHCPLNPYSLFT